MNRRTCARRLFCAVALLPLLVLAACRSDHVQVTIENHTGGPVQLLELDYPNASFGADRIAAGADFHYRIQVRGTSALNLSYTGTGNKQYQIKGPELADHSQGSLHIVLLPAGKADFQPSLTVRP